MADTILPSRKLRKSRSQRGRGWHMANMCFKACNCYAFAIQKHFETIVRQLSRSPSIRVFHTNRIADHNRPAYPVLAASPMRCRARECGYTRYPTSLRCRTNVFFEKPYLRLRGITPHVNQKLNIVFDKAVQIAFEGRPFVADSEKTHGGVIRALASCLDGPLFLFHS